MTQAPTEMTFEETVQALDMLEGMPVGVAVSANGTAEPLVVVEGHLAKVDSDQLAEHLVDDLDAPDVMRAYQVLVSDGAKQPIVVIRRHGFRPLGVVDRDDGDWSVGWTTGDVVIVVSFTGGRIWQDYERDASRDAEGGERHGA